MTIEDGSRRLAVPADQASSLRLGDKTWSDNARIGYRLPQAP